MNTAPNFKAGLVSRILRSPPARVFVLGFILLLMIGLNSDILSIYAGEPVKSIKHIIALAIAGLAIYISYAHFIEQRSVHELSLPGIGSELGRGLLIGAGLYSTCTLILMIIGLDRINGINPWSFMLPAVAMALSSGIFEELLFRGVLFRSVEEWLGTWVALVFSSLVFGMTHLINPHGTLEGAFFIAVEAGTLLAAAFILTRRLWMSIGFHVAWNYTQSGIFSGIVSGNEAAQGLIRSTIRGPDFLTGGSFGVESSVIALLLCTTTAMMMLMMAIKGGKIVAPVWRRKS